MENSPRQIEKNVSASFGYVKKDMLMLNDAFSDIHDKVQHLSLNHAMLLEQITKLRTEISKVSGKKVTKTKTVTIKKSTKKKDDLAKIEGIGPAIKKLLWKNKIRTYKDLANTPVQNLREILEKSGSMFKMHNPSTWARQSKLAFEKRWDELEKLQEKLDGGVVKKIETKNVKKVATKNSEDKGIKKVVKETITYE
ncbi:helix-hairpin-helix domain-containing protein [archaeon]|jgi:predicted flap endonuclease-1-like 5' DNA nuclease|nr:helix-hairpin-helix domain-containing protein [archaeon]MBT7128523.1 helix-hairpin-helix domain-containing protein [archaeon]